MDRDALRAHCLAQKGAVEDFPFGEDTAVYKVGGRMFAILPVRGALAISLKCDPEWARVLRETYPAVTGGYHLNKRHWNTVRIDGSVPDDEVFEMIEHSYGLVLRSLPRRVRDELKR